MKIQLKKIKILDLFSGLGGMKLGFSEAALTHGYETETIAFSDLKTHSQSVLTLNFPNIPILHDITKIDEKELPDFDFLLGGFPCQSFSTAGKRAGFEDSRGTLFFDIARILKEKQPFGFLLENVEGLITHNKKNKTDKIGSTLKNILEILESLNYHVSWKLINAADYGVPQERKRVYILGTKKSSININLINDKKTLNKNILQQGLPIHNSNFVKKLLSNFKLKDLYGKSIKDKRGGSKNIHSWDIGIKGSINKRQSKLLNTILLERRKKHWAISKKIPWMDGMPLTYNEITTFINYKDLKSDLDLLLKKGYLKLEHPKGLVLNPSKNIFERKEDLSKEIGYNIITGKLSFEISTILDPNGFCPTLLATDLNKIFVVDDISKGLRQLSIQELLGMFGYPLNYNFGNLTKNEILDLIGNTVVIPVISKLSDLLIKDFEQFHK
jgi:DNA (cytosine-5)-methyltransferase 1